MITEYIIKLTLQDLQILNDALSKEAYRDVAALFAKLNTQIKDQQEGSVKERK